jgi:hypothetical protein
MLDWNTKRPYGAPEQAGGSQMFRQKKNDPLQSALTAGPMGTAVEPGRVETPVAQPPSGSVPSAPAALPPATPDYTKLGKYTTFNAGAADKYNKPWDQLSERYKMQTILSNFDPSGGITPDVINALNTAGGGINGATFSGSKDKLDARGLQKWENYDGREGIGDIIQGFNDPNNKNKSWGAWQPEGPAQGGLLGPQMPSMGIFDNPNVGAGDLPQTSADSASLLQQILAQLSDPTMKKALQY